MQRREGVAIGEGVEAGAENYILSDPVGDRGCEAVFGIAAAGDHEEAKVARYLVHGAFHIAGESGADQAHGNGIVENARPIDELVGGAANGNAKGCLAGAAGLH
jgi:hypothetical protein